MTVSVSVIVSGVCWQVAVRLLAGGLALGCACLFMVSAALQAPQSVLSVSQRCCAA